MTNPGRSAAKNALVAHAAVAGITVTSLLLAAGTARAQEVSSQAPSQPRAFTGQDFAGQNFPLAPVKGSIAFTASKAWAWRQGDTRRLLLSGDVRVTLANYRFKARQAAVWLRQLPGEETYQVFVAFDQVGNPEDASNFGLVADRLPVKAVIAIDAPLKLTCDTVIDGHPGDNAAKAAAFVTESEAMLAISLSRLVDPTSGTVTLPPAPFVKAMRQTNLPPPPPEAPAIAMTPAPKVTKPREGEPATSESSRAKLLKELAAREAGEALPPTPEAAKTVGVRAAPTTPATDAGDKTAATATAPANAQGSKPQAAAQAAANAAPSTSSSATTPASEIFANDGIVTLSAKDISVVSETDETSVVATNGVIVQYADTRSGRVLQINAQRAVIFMDPVKLDDAGTLSVKSIRGMYLEGDVTAGDGKFTLRGPQVYYDIRRNSAVMLDAVFWTYDDKRRLPLYVRAKSIRQTAADQFVAEKATLTNTAMLDPELSIGVSSVTITRQTMPAAAASTGAAPAAATAGTSTTGTTTQVEASGVTVRAAGLPIFYWPTYSGDPAIMPIKDLRVESRSGSGIAVKATFNAYALLGIKRPGDNRFDLYTDYYMDRGPALGTRLGWNTADSKGSLLAYMVPTDSGTDLLKPGTKLDHQDEFRGVIAGEQRLRLDEHWSVFAEGSYLSDPTFIDAFFENQGETRREFTNRFRADRTEGNTQFSVEAKGTFNDFISNEWLLQSQGYSTTKLPEVTYTRQADDLLSQTHPGLLSYWSESRIGALQLAFDEIRPDERGFTTPGLSQRAFGLDPTQSFGDKLRAMGYFEDTVYRGDTRHEISLNANVGPVRVQPFLEGRLTAYDNSFSAFSPDEEDETRLQGAAGVRVSTSFARIYDGVDSSLLDIHRLRHVIEPNMTLWQAGTTVNSASLPVYDPTVESLADGTILRVGATQTLQTQRGAAGRWHTTDLLVLNTDFVSSSGNADQKGPIGRIFDYRPEYANPGDYFVGDAVYRLTDATSLTGSTVFDFTTNQQAMSTAGLIIRHSPEFSTFGDLRFINALDSTYLNVGASYEFTAKYSATLTAAYDLDLGGFQTTDFEIRRNFASMLLGVNVSYNDITGETGLGFMLRPFGAGGDGRLNGSTSSDFGR